MVDLFFCISVGSADVGRSLKLQLVFQGNLESYIIITMVLGDNMDIMKDFTLIYFEIKKKTYEVDLNFC